MTLGISSPRKASIGSHPADFLMGILLGWPLAAQGWGVFWIATLAHNTRPLFALPAALSLQSYSGICMTKNWPSLTESGVTWRLRLLAGGVERRKTPASHIFNHRHGAFLGVPEWYGLPGLLRDLASLSIPVLQPHARARINTSSCQLEHPRVAETGEFIGGKCREARRLSRLWDRIRRWSTGHLAPA